MDFEPIIQEIITNLSNMRGTKKVPLVPYGFQKDKQRYGLLISKLCEEKKITSDEFNKYIKTIPVFEMEKDNINYKKLKNGKEKMFKMNTQILYLVSNSQIEEEIKRNPVEMTKLVLGTPLANLAFEGGIDDSYLDIMATEEEAQKSEIKQILSEDSKGSSEGFEIDSMLDDVLSEGGALDEIPAEPAPKAAVPEEASSGTPEKLEVSAIDSKLDEIFFEDVTDITEGQPSAKADEPKKEEKIEGTLSDLDKPVKDDI